jgi:dCTP deaminase
VNEHGILSGNRILEEVEKGTIVIDPFDKKFLNPNSYNLHLADELLTYDHSVLDMKREEPYTIERMSSMNGKLLIPGKLYLARTQERTFTDGFVPMLEGRSSIGRLWIFIHATAGFGDNGFDGYWTLEISCVQPVIIYPGVEVGQIYYHTLADTDSIGEAGVPVHYTHGKYQKNNGIQPSMLWKEFQE